MSTTTTLTPHQPFRIIEFFLSREAPSAHVNTSGSGDIEHIAPTNAVTLFSRYTPGTHPASEHIVSSFPCQLFFIFALFWSLIRTGMATTVLGPALIFNGRHGPWVVLHSRRNCLAFVQGVCTLTYPRFFIRAFLGLALALGEHKISDQLSTIFYVIYGLETVYFGVADDGLSTETVSISFILLTKFLFANSTPHTSQQLRPPRGLYP